jgi:hypothetical protein
VGSCADRRVTRRRRDMCLEWAGANLQRGPIRRLLSKVAIRMRMALFCGVGVAIRANEGAGDYAARVALARGDTPEAFELVEALLAVGDRRAPTRSAPAARNGRPSANGDGSAHSNGSAAVPIGTDGRPATPGVAPNLNGEPAPNGQPAPNGEREGRDGRVRRSRPAPSGPPRRPW